MNDPTELIGAPARQFARRLLGGLGWIGLGLGVGFAVRFLAIEPEAIGQACLQAGSPWPCVLRQGLISLFHFGIFGGTAVAAGLYVLARRYRGRADPRPAWVRGSLILGALALALYNAGLGSVAVVLALLAAMGTGHDPE